LLGAKFDTRRQDEEAKINETKDMLQEGFLLVYPLFVCVRVQASLPPIRGNYPVIAPYYRKGMYAYLPRSGTNIV